MSFDETLRKVEYDLARGDEEHAKQRLTGMLCYFAYPMNLQVRRMLGDIHWRRGNVIEAGRYWYLEADKTPAMQAACERYEKACGHSAQTIGRRLKFQGNLKILRQTSPYAADLLVRLQAEARAELAGKPPFALFDSTGLEDYYRGRIEKADHQQRQILKRLLNMVF